MRAVSFEPGPREHDTSGELSVDRQATGPGQRTMLEHGNRRHAVQKAGEGLRIRLVLHRVLQQVSRLDERVALRR